MSKYSSLNKAVKGASRFLHSVLFELRVGVIGGAVGTRCGAENDSQTQFATSQNSALASAVFA